MTEQEFFDHFGDLTAEQIATGILSELATFEECQDTGVFSSTKQTRVKEILKKKDMEFFESTINLVDLDEKCKALEKYLRIFPKGIKKDEVVKMIQEIRDRKGVEKNNREKEETMLQKLENDINAYTPSEIRSGLSDKNLDYVCNKYGINKELVKKFRDPFLTFNDIPQDKDDVPVGYTDVFFWGIPSSGKTSALGAILSTIKIDYNMEDPTDDIKFGATYRHSLINTFSGEWVYIPGRTNVDRTQYMPFQLYQRGEKNKRKISFFELSGEMFRHFYEEVYNTTLVEIDQEVEIDQTAEMDQTREEERIEKEREMRTEIKKTFESLELLLNNDNQKVHFFFIDYNREIESGKPDKYGLTQSNYLEAAATYFRDKKKIFKEKTNAVNVVVTKADQIQGDDKGKAAKSFLNENFGSFMYVLKNQCEGYSINFKIKHFSIGKVYFKRICEINREYSKDIIDDLLFQINPQRRDSFIKRLIKKINS